MIGRLLAVVQIGPSRTLDHRDLSTSDESFALFFSALRRQLGITPGAFPRTPL